MLGTGLLKAASFKATHSGHGWKHVILKMSGVIHRALLYLSAQKLLYNGNHRQHKSLFFFS